MSSASSQEDSQDYVAGGYLPLGEGAALGSYKVVSKLGWGHFSTVWLAESLVATSPKTFNDPPSTVALKVVKAAKQYTETALDEIKLLERVNATKGLWKLQDENTARPVPDFDLNSFVARQDMVKQNPAFADRIIELLSWFYAESVNGKHVVLVFEVLGINLLQLLKVQRDEAGSSGDQDRPPHSAAAKKLATQNGSADTKSSATSKQNGAKNDIALPTNDQKNSTREGCLPILVVKRIAKQVLEGLLFLHDGCGIIHTDLKLENILLEAQPPVLAAPVWREEIDLDLDISLADVVDGENIGNVSRAVDVGLDQDSEKIIAHDSHGHSQGAQSALFSKLPLAKYPNYSKIESSQSVEFDSQNDAATSNDNMDQDGTSQSVDQANQDKRLARKHLYLYENLININVKICDLGNACLKTKQYTQEIQTRQYRCPEVILGGKYTETADIWSFGCILFELLTGDYLFDPKTGTKYSKDDDHLALISELLGKIPRKYQVGTLASEFFSRRGDLRRISKLRFWGFKDVLMQKYHWSIDDATALASFLVPCFNFDVGKRASARQLLADPWLAGV